MIRFRQEQSRLIATLLLLLVGSSPPLLSVRALGDVRSLVVVGTATAEASVVVGATDDVSREWSKKTSWKGNEELMSL